MIKHCRTELQEILVLRHIVVLVLVLVRYVGFAMTHMEVI
jgi:hypothetical protein